eukprot:m51a1_g838 putative protein tyrosine phosphatase (321) ;mRNA; f:759395-760572
MSSCDWMRVAECLRGEAVIVPQIERPQSELPDEPLAPPSPARSVSELPASSGPSGGALCRVPELSEVVRTTSVELFNNHANWSCVVVDVRPVRDFEESHIKGAASAWHLAHELAPSGGNDYSTVLVNTPLVRLWRRRRQVVFCADSEMTLDEFEATVAPLWRRAGPVVAQSVLAGGFAEWSRRYPFLCTAPVAPGDEYAIDAASESELGTIEYPSEILRDFLYLGGMGSYCPRVIADLNITRVVRVLPIPDAELEGVRLLHVPLLDNLTDDILSHFDEITSFINDARDTSSRTLVHCAAGVSSFLEQLAMYEKRLAHNSQ